MNTQKDTRTIFLEEFIKRLIINSFQKISKIEKNDNLLEKLETTAIIPPIIGIQKKVEEKPVQKIEVKKVEEKIIQKVEERKIQETAMERIMRPLAPEQQMQRTQQPQSQPLIQRASESKKVPGEINIPVLGRLNPILADPAVQSINCPGSDRNLLVTRRGMIQSIPLSFSTKEINEFIKDISEKTKIPLLPGLFKVVFQNLIITAIISEFVGSKFLVEKREPQTLPQMPIKVQFK